MANPITSASTNPIVQAANANVDKATSVFTNPNPYGTTPTTPNQSFPNQSFGTPIVSPTIPEKTTPTPITTAPAQNPPPNVPVPEKPTPETTKTLSGSPTGGTFGSNAQGQQTWTDNQGNVYTGVPHDIGTANYGITWNLTQPAQGITPNNTNTNNAITTPQGLDMSDILDQNAWYKQDKGMFTSWAKAQGWTDLDINAVGQRVAMQQQEDDINKGRDLMTQFENGTYPLTPDQQAALDATKKLWENTVAMQKDANQTYTSSATMMAGRTGRGEYNLVDVMGDVNRALNEGINKVAYWNIKETEALANMRAGFMKDNFEMVSKAQEIIQQGDKAKLDAINKVQDDLNAKAKDIRDFEYKAKQDQITNDLNSDKFDWQQKMDMIDAAVKEGSLEETKANNLRNYVARMREIDEASWSVTDGGLGRKIAVNKMTGETRKIDMPEFEGSRTAKIFADAAQKAMGGVGTSAERKSQISSIQEDLTDGNLTAAKDQIMAMIANKTGNQDIKKIAQAKGGFELVQKAMDEYIAAGGDPGILNGSVEFALNKIGTTTGEKAAYFKSLADAARFAYTQSVSGAQFTESEAKRYYNITPALLKSEKLNASQIKAMTDMSNQRIKEIAIGTIGDTAYRNIFLTPEENVKELKLSKPETTPVVETMLAEGKDWSDILEIIDK